MSTATYTIMHAFSNLVLQSQYVCYVTSTAPQVYSRKVMDGLVIEQTVLD
jgi:hypothetical protein